MKYKQKLLCIQNQMNMQTSKQTTINNNKYNNNTNESKQTTETPRKRGREIQFRSIWMKWIKRKCFEDFAVFGLTPITSFYLELRLLAHSKFSPLFSQHYTLIFQTKQKKKIKLKKNKTTKIQIFFFKLKKMKSDE